MSESNVNIPLLRKAVEWAEAEAAKPPEVRQWDQGWWVTLPAERAEEFEVDEAACGTAYCIAGWTCHAAGDVFDESRSECVSNLADGTHISYRARDLLGISSSGAEALFYGGNTIADVRRIAESIAGERL